MACDRFTGAIRDRALGSALPLDAAAHLAVCADCQAVLAAEEQVLATIDVALKTVMTAAPSPSFLSRVRAHVERAAPRWTPSPWWLLAPAAAAALLIASATLIRSPRDTSPAGQVASVSPAETPVAKPRVAGAAPTPTRAVAPPPLGRAPARSARVTPAPEVLVPGAEREAVGRLFASLRAGRPEVVSMLMNLPEGESRITERSVIIEPLRIEPVVVSAMPLSVPILER